ncbi:MAG: ATP-binding cassette domain-containing protein, partial [Streptosporangiales bacterium]|nr:ATP-binding cassette domain-containing protein [Streptosporangiales bacterium]
LGAVRGGRTIAAAAAARTEADRVLVPLARLRRHGAGTWRAQARLTAQGALLVPWLQVAVVGLAGAEVAWGRITPGELLAAARYVALGTGVGMAIGGLNRLLRARTAARRAAEVLGRPVPSYGARSLPSGPGRLELRGVWARGAGGRVLEDVWLDVPGGAAVAVAGRAGSGKSLLAALPGRLAEPEQGTVLIDGVPVHELSRDALGRAVAYAFERPELFGATVRDAIAAGPGTGVPPEARLRAAARAAYAEEFVLRLPGCYDTPLPEAHMSGGERQRLGLARAFAHGGRVLVLDDATSSLDTVTELRVNEAVAAGMAGRTRLIVAHRAATAAAADLVAWLDAGRLRALAPHGTLWRDPDYRAIFAPVGLP